MKDKFVVAKNSKTFELINITNIALCYQDTTIGNKITIVTKNGDKTHITFDTIADSKQFCTSLASELGSKEL